MVGPPTVRMHKFYEGGVQSKMSRMKATLIFGVMSVLSFMLTRCCNCYIRDCLSNTLNHLLEFEDILGTVSLPSQVKCKVCIHYTLHRHHLWRVYYTQMFQLLYNSISAFNLSHASLNMLHLHKIFSDS